MTKRQFIALADTLLAVNEYLTREVLDALCQFCLEQNPKFDEKKFREYLAERMVSD